MTNRSHAVTFVRLGCSFEMASRGKLMYCFIFVWSAVEHLQSATPSQWHACEEITPPYWPITCLWGNHATLLAHHMLVRKSRHPIGLSHACEEITPPYWPITCLWGNHATLLAYHMLVRKSRHPIGLSHACEEITPPYWPITCLWGNHATLLAYHMLVRPPYWPIKSRHPIGL